MTDFYATAPRNLQHLLDAELKQLGASQVRQAGAGVSFSGELETAYRACLWSRTANRVLLPLLPDDPSTLTGITDGDRLYQATRSFDWAAHMSESQTLAIDFFTAQSDLTHSQFGAQRVKDAVVDQFREATGTRPSVERAEPDLRINVYLFRNRTRFAIDLAGTSLHRRGFRETTNLAQARQQRDKKATNTTLTMQRVRSGHQAAEQQRQATKLDGSAASLKENLAAALLLSCDWPVRAARGEPFHDPMCGSGTLVIEAAMIAADIAPGLQRPYFGFTGWRQHQPQIWQALLTEAQHRATAGRARQLPRISGSDQAPHAITVARGHAEQAGVAELVDFDVADFPGPLPETTAPRNSTDVHTTGLVLFNPPYGERLERDLRAATRSGTGSRGATQRDKPRAARSAWSNDRQRPERTRSNPNDQTQGAFMHQLGRGLRERYAGWQCGFLTTEPALAYRLRFPIEVALKLSNGGIDIALLRAEVPSASATDATDSADMAANGATEPDATTAVAGRRPDASPATTTAPAGDAETAPRMSTDAVPAATSAASPPAPASQENVADFANRLRKNLRRLSKWLQREQIRAWRLYDADIPEYAVAVDCYLSGDAPWQTDDNQHWHIVVQEYQPPSRVNSQRAEARLQALMAVLPEVLACPAQQVRLKVRQRQRGQQQYQRSGHAGKMIEVDEYGARLLVNLDDYLDTGLFLDHRKVRHYIREHASGKRFLNLFAYTATASVHAALGGASSTLSLDLSSRYCQWAQQNLANNASSSAAHVVERVDVLGWLDNPPPGAQFDLILLDPPTFSNSSSMDSNWDVQRDHAAVIDQCMALLAADGCLIFSNNFRQFRLDPMLAERFDVDDRSRWSLHPDFERNPKIHRCWFIRPQRHSGAAAGKSAAAGNRKPGR